MGSKFLSGFASEADLFELQRKQYETGAEVIIFDNLMMAIPQAGDVFEMGSIS